MWRSKFSSPLPIGFSRVSVGDHQVMWLADGQDAHVLAASILTPGRDRETSYVGRAKLYSVPLANGDAGLVRSYQHGGLFRHWTRDRFFTWPPRPLLELAATIEARQRGVGTLEVVAALAAYGPSPFYRGWLVTRELKKAENLWAYFQATDTPVPGLMEQVGRAVRSMHHAGVCHADLNMRNILIRSGSQDLEVLVIDFDKARLFAGPVPLRYRHRNLTRLLRSVRKLDPSSQRVSDGHWSAFLSAYDEH